MRVKSTLSFAAAAFLVPCMLMGAHDVRAEGHGLRLSSPAFSPGGPIPRRYTCDGSATSPGLVIQGVPRRTRSLVLIVVDPDAPGGEWTHWLLWDIKPDTGMIREGASPTGAISGMNDFRRYGYGGPCPPGGTHRYIFRLYALDTVIHISRNSKRTVLEKAMQGHIVGRTELMGRYTRR